MIKNTYFENTGILVPEILLPKDGTDITKWAVVAVDQFTSEPSYWEKLSDFVKDSPSALNLVLPEVYLGTEKEKQLEDMIQRNMKSYPENVLTRKVNGFIVVKRTISGKTRTGVVLALDLEKYDFREGSDALVRATEKTVIERIPARVEIRKKASVELPHILVLINDKGNKAISNLEKSKGEKLYDFELSMGGGHIEGYSVTDADAIDNFNEALSKILPFAVGDGNHSFAAAKAYWDELKKNGAPKNHPARFALCEIENIYDEGIAFEPIHRVVFGVNYDEFIDGLTEYLGENAGFAEDFKNDFVEPENDNENYHKVKIITCNRTGTLYIDRKYTKLAVTAVQKYLETLTDKKVDYIHNLKNTVDLSKKENVGILLPKISKDDVFDFISEGAVLPKKTFSMGLAEGKRYYLEARKIREENV